MAKTNPEFDTSSLDFTAMLNARKAEVDNLKELTEQRGTPIPTLFSTYYKFIQNPSSVSVDTFKRMIDTDETIGAGTDFLTTCLAARMGMYKHKSPEITEWVNARLQELEGGWNNKIKEAFSASWAGLFCGEKVWANTDNGFVIERIAPLPPSTVLFEVDRCGRITSDGVLQYQRNYMGQGGSGLGMGMGMLGVSTGFNMSNYEPDMFARLGDLSYPLRTANPYTYLSIRIPRQKVIHYAFDAQGKFDNPYGRSLLRRCYKWWVVKDAILKMFMTALDRKGTPMTVIWVDPNTTLKDPRKVTNALKADGARNKSVGMDAMAAVAEAFKNPHTDSVFVVPGKKGQIVDVQAITTDFNADAFINGIQMCDRAMLRALLIPALIFSAGDGSGSFALGQEHARTWDKILDGTLSGFHQVLIEQVITEMLGYNFPKSAWEKDGFGEFTQRELTTEERQKEMEVVEKAVNMGAVDMNDLNDLNEVREKAGFSARTEVIPQDDFGLEGEEGEFGDDSGGNDGGVPGGGKAPNGSKKGQPKVDNPRRTPGGRGGSGGGRSA